MTDKTRICFVCLGNIVRSPLAESLFRKLAEEAGAEDRFELDSAGTSSYHVGEAPDSRMRRVAADHGLRYSGRARQFLASDFDKFDLVIAMDPDNQGSLLRMARSEAEKSKVLLMRAFDSAANADMTVPDPYYGGRGGFESTYAIIERSCRGLLDALQSGQL